MLCEICVGKIDHDLDHLDPNVPLWDVQDLYWIDISRSRSSRSCRYGMLCKICSGQIDHDLYNLDPNPPLWDVQDVYNTDISRSIPSRS